MIANVANFLFLLFFLWGRAQWSQNLRLHIRAMQLAFVLDLSLVLALVILRDALGQVSMDMHWTLKVHIPIAITTLAMYVLTGAYGFQLHWGNEAARAKLRFCDKILVTARILTFVTSMMVTILR